MKKKEEVIRLLKIVAKKSKDGEDSDELIERAYNQIVELVQQSDDTIAWTPIVDPSERSVPL